MNDGEVSLDPHPTQSTLPVSPIFICSSETPEVANNPQQRNQSKKNNQQEHHLMPADLALVEATVNEVQDLEALLAAVTETVEVVEENKIQVSIIYNIYTAYHQ